MTKKILSLLLTSLILTTPVTSVLTNSTIAYASNLNEASKENSIDIEISKSLEKTANFLSSRDKLGEWQVPSMVRLGKITDSQKENILKDINARIDKKYAEEYSSQMAKDILVLTSLGKNPQTYKSFDLVNEMISKKDYLGSCNYEVWILLCSTINTYSISDENKAILDEIICDILKCQNENGGFSYTPDGSWIDVDMTGMAIFALSTYNKTSEIENAIKKGKAYILSELSKNNGKFDNSNTTAMAILGLSSVGYDCKDLVCDLLTYKLEDGSFTWKKDEPESNDFSTEQCLYSLIQYSAAKDNKNIFNFKENWTYSELINNITSSNTNVTTNSPSNNSSSTPNGGEEIIGTQTTTTTASSTPTSDNKGLFLAFSFLICSTLSINYFKRRNLND